jgi:hypothetical protein
VTADVRYAAARRRDAPTGRPSLWSELEAWRYLAAPTGQSDSKAMLRIAAASGEAVQDNWR